MSYYKKNIKINKVFLKTLVDFVSKSLSRLVQLQLMSRLSGPAPMRRIYSDPSCTHKLCRKANSKL